MTVQTHPAAVEIRGRLCLEDERGAFVPVTQVSEVDLLEDELVRKLHDFAVPLSAELARFKAKSFGDIEAFLDLLAQEHKVERRRGKKGNLTLFTFDRRCKVEIKSSERISFGPQLQMAKAKIDECLLKWGASADPRLQAVVNSAFEVDQEGRVSPARVMLLRRTHITDDDAWDEAMAAIDAAIRVLGTKFYMRFHRRQGADDAWSGISLDFADVEMTPEAETAFSARRELQEAAAAKAQAIDMLRSALSHLALPTGNATTAADLVRCALQVLGANPAERAAEPDAETSAQL